MSGLGIAVVCIGVGILLRHSDRKSAPLSSGRRQRVQLSTGSAGLTYQDAFHLKLGTPHAAVAARFGHPLPRPPGEPLRVGQSRCVYYAYAGHPEAMFQLCFENGRGLVTVATRLP